MTTERIGQVWLFRGGTPLRELLLPHGFRERATRYENLEHDELSRADDGDPARERAEIEL
jgi:hypothetical protein